MRAIKPKFVASADGPQGGSVAKWGVSGADARLRHEDGRVWLEIRGYLQDGVPYAVVEAYDLDKRETRVLYRGPLSEAVKVKP